MAKSKKPKIKKIKAPPKKNPADKPLTDQEKVFVAAYCVTMNATQAATDAGYTVEVDEDEEYPDREHRKLITKLAWELKRRPNVAKAIRKNISDRLDSINCKAEEVLREISYIAFGRATDVVSIEELDPDHIPSHDQVYIMDRKGDLLPARSSEVPQLFKAYRVNILDTSYWGKAQHAAVTGIQQDKDGNIKIQFADKQKALETLAKYFNLVKPDTAVSVGEGAIMIVPATVESLEEWEQRSIKSRQRSAEASRELTKNG